MKILLTALIVYFLFSASVYILQDNMLFLRQNIGDRDIEKIRQMHPDAEEITLKTPDDITLHGWLIPDRKITPSPLLIYFGGNAEEVSHLISLKNDLPGWSLLLINYRGYGLSEGRPGEKEILADALLIYDVFSENKAIDRNRIALMGRSIGCAPAVYLSARRSIAGTILVSPFGSMADVAAAAYPLLPVRLLMKHKLHMLPHAAEAENTMICLAGSDDKIIPLRHSRKLFKAWKGEKRLHLIEHAGHNDISLFPSFWIEIKAFLGTL